MRVRAGAVLSAAILAGGLTLAGIGPARAANAGDLDVSWGSSGQSASTPGTGRAAAVDSQGRVYAGAALDYYGPGSVVRYDAEGSLDPSFTPVNLAGQGRHVWSEWKLAVQAVEGAERLLALDGFHLRRFTTTGAPDHTFGDGGATSTRISPVVGATSPVDFELSDDGRRIVYLGHVDAFLGAITYSPWPLSLPFGGAAVPSGLSLVVFDEDGRRDQSFGAGGTAAIAGPGAIGCVVLCQYVGARIVPADLEVASDGSILVGGHLETESWQAMKPVLFKFRPDGGLDQSFGEKGVLIGPSLSEPATAGAPWSSVSALVELPAGRLLVATRHCSNNSGRRWCVRADVRRLDGRGALDTSFGDAGVTMLPQGFLNVDDLLIDGATNAAYAVQDSYDFDAVWYYAGAVARLQGDGTLDASFGDGGAIVTGEYAGTQAIDALGRIYAPRSDSLAGPTYVSRHLAAASSDGETTVVTTWGTVTEHRTGRPIAGASIDCDGKAATAGTDGGYVLGLAPGTYTCTASAAGYRSVKERREVFEGVGPFDYVLRPQR